MGSLTIGYTVKTGVLAEGRVKGQGQTHADSCPRHRHGVGWQWCPFQEILLGQLDKAREKVT